MVTKVGGIMEEQKNKKSYNVLELIIVGIVIIALTTLLGLITFWTTGELRYMEIIYLAVGVIVLLFAMARIRLRDRKNLKETKSVYENKKTFEYKKWLISQWIIVGIGLITCLASLIPFFIEYY
jgi:uncharacterized membrane protein